MIPADRRYIVNADDFGLSAPVNAAIVQAFEEGLISSTTMLATARDFEQACSLAQEHALNGSIGVHLNLTEGRPLTGNILRMPRFADSTGCFSFRLSRASLRLSKEEKEAVSAEWAAQIRRCLDNDIQPSHLDSHHHVHTVSPLLSVAISLARTFAIPFVRLSRNAGPGIAPSKSVFKLLINSRLRASRLAGTQFFGSAADLAPVHRGLSGRIEVMVHPRLDDDKLIDVSPIVPHMSLHDTIRILGIKGQMLSYTDVASQMGRGR